VFGGMLSVSQVTEQFLVDLRYREVRRLVRVGEAEVNAVRKQKEGWKVKSMLVPSGAA
jgi:hypothetical protein